ncbi:MULTISPECIES: TetR/AcrR family transcriptional regulator C-terminal domain-containing protein [Kitasatospora]|uniref:Putative TetR family transcriptional regulator n=1 Tax=Kitasatospora setae (strain ATCC 33774 / DSM 43861 / JCM 3304 / KCC A-0304 / NBRC 14216 / KM-6054) TaxID=452652 RepID=E4NJ14_KITSK|nr:TetR/AcrR family transcriptional regulator C-terminal domain-containing protein [Kitasatospora setae]BAJ32962.1 putative TetR family transcriptional regulator [Kitasatospora setae KM-6054]
MDRYEQIAAELRGRIEHGELRPGDRVPSTREITRRWNVAMATATRVLAELRGQGLVRAVPGVGTVVAGNPSPASGPSSSTSPSTVPEAGRAPRTAGRQVPRRPAPEGVLTAERIVAAAIGVADGEGLEALSMRRVAAELDAATMSLYRHVPDKDGLVELMMDRVFADLAFSPAETRLDWRARLELAARRLWALFRAHPWLASAMSVTRPQPLPNALPFGEWMLAAMAGAGLDLQSVLTAYLTLVNYVRGTALNLELEAAAEAATGQDAEAWMDQHEPRYAELVAAHPTFRRLTEEGYDFDLDQLFEFGLQRLLDGLAALVAETAGAERP